MTETIKWYINRFQTFSGDEVAFRVVQAYKSRLMRWRNKMNDVPEYFNTRTHNLLVVEEADDIIADPTINIFGSYFNPGDIQDWNVDLASGKRFPSIYAKLINIRNDQYGSAKHVWELNRMLVLPQLALEFRKFKRSETLDLIIKLLSGWIDQNPYLTGVNWYSNIEVNIRLINWVLTWDILDIDHLKQHSETLNDFVVNKWIPSIYCHCKFSYENPSLHSSANNHLISEYAGLFIANCKWRFPESEEWIKYSRKGLETQIGLQHSLNGVNKEETAKYIQFITDFLLLCLIFGQRSGLPLSPSYEKKIHKICGYIYELLDIKGNVPNYGDEDDGRVFRLDRTPNCNNFFSILTSGAIYFNDESLLRSTSLDQKNRILFGKAAQKVFKKPANCFKLRASKVYAEEGHCIFRLQEDNSQEIYFHFDAAPLGYLSIAAHGHADSLSFILHVDGIPYLVDSGTYCYHTHPEWRKYFLSTVAHNTIAINHENQATFIGPTLWLDHFKSTVIDYGLSDTRDFIIAEHDGYVRYKINHRRKVEFLKKLRQFIITDEIINRGSKNAQIEMPFHIHPNVECHLSGSSLTLTYPGSRTVTIQLDPQLNWRLYKGNLSPTLGWYSSSFYQKEASPVVIGSVSASISLSFSTTITIN